MKTNSKAKAILAAIAEGRAYDQIIREGIADSYLEIFAAAREALSALAQASQRSGKRYPNRGKPWSKADEQRLAFLYERGVEVEDLCKIFGRTERGILSRLDLLGFELEEDDDYDDSVEEEPEPFDPAGWVVDTNHAPATPVVPSPQPHQLPARSSAPLTFCWGPGCNGLVENYPGAKCPECGRVAHGADPRRRFDTIRDR